jgi:hypothetical protein
LRGRGNKKDSAERGNGNGRTRNGSEEGRMRKTVWGEGMRMTEHGMAAYPLPP